MNRRSFLAALSGSLVALPTLASAKLYDENPCKEILRPLSRGRPPYPNAPIMVLPREVGWRLIEYREAYGDKYWVITDSMAVAGYRGNGVVIFGFTGMPQDRIDYVKSTFATRCRFGFEVAYW
ncbi:MAG: hypothetical protein ACKO0Z_07430 [Betaproteobacteria bacterium]